MNERRRLVIVNPASGSGKTRKKWPALKQQLIERAANLASDDDGAEIATLEFYETTGPNDATVAVRTFIAGGGRSIIVCGGDGTLNEVVDGCVVDGAVSAPDIDIAVVHQGTGGDVARGLDIPKERNAALDVAFGSAVQRCDLGYATYSTPDGEASRAFISCVNVGMGADVVQRATGRVKKLGDTASFAVAAVSHLVTNKPRAVQVTRTTGSGETRTDSLEIVDIMIANNRYVGGGMLVAPQAVIDDGLLDLVMINTAGTFKLIRTFPQIYSGKHIHDPLVRCETVTEVEVTTPAAPQGVVLDGELVGSTPVRISVIPNALDLHVAC